MFWNKKHFFTLFVIVSLVLLCIPPALAMDPLPTEWESSGSPFLSGENQCFTLEVPAEGDYQLRMRYIATGAGVQKLAFALRVNGELQQEAHEHLSLPSSWKDESDTYWVNEFGSELFPIPVLTGAELNESLRERVYCADAPLLFHLQAGINQVEIEVTESSATFLGVTATWAQTIPDVASYTSSLPAQPGQGSIMLEGEKYTTKSDSDIRPDRSRSTAFHPFDAAAVRINSLAGSTWDEPGESVTYQFTIDHAGVYYLALRYQQSEKSDMDVFKTIRIDGVTLCDALAAYGFAYTGSGVQETFVQTEDGAIPFYLEAGEHQLTFVSTAEPVAQAHAMLRQVVTDMNNLALDIKMISSNKVDADRDWNLEYYVPGTRACLEDIQTKIAQVYDLLEKGDVGSGQTTLSTLVATQRQIEKYLTEKDGLNDLVNQLSSFAHASGSLAESLSLLAPDMLLQPLTIDRIYWLDQCEQLPGEDMGALQSAWQEVRKTVLSFLRESDTAQTQQKDKLNVWLVGSAQELEILRELVSLAYPDGSVHVSLANENKIQLAIAADNAPDVVLGSGVSNAYQLGIRNALYDLAQFEDFTAYSENFYAQSLVPLTLEEQVFALPQTLDMWVTFYRKDILDKLGLEVPVTWDDMISIMPTLYRYGLEVNTALSSGGALKSFTQMMPLIMQNGGELYAADGMSATFTTPEFIKGFTYLTEMYTKYGASTSIGNFYSSFRNGTAPIGVSALTTYTLLRKAANELDGMWGISLMPAVVQEDGTLSRSHPAVVTSCYILSATQRAEESWNFLKWWMSASVQSTFSERLQSIYGEEYLWITANKQALSQTTLFADQDREIILAQMEAMQEVPPHPASMLVQRALSDAYNKVVFSGVDVRSALDTAQLEANRGIRKKLQQFGLMDELGNVITPLWKDDEP